MMSASSGENKGDEFVMAIIKESISEQIYNLIKEQIFNQELKLGSRIDTKKFAEEHNISMMPVRDALNRLENQGLISRKSRVGYFVRSFSRKEAEEIMEVRKMYEIYSLEEHFDKIERDSMKKILRKSTENNNISREDFDQLDDSLHNLIISGSGNNFLINCYNQVVDQITLFRRLDKNRIRSATEEHIKLINAILSGELERSRKMLKLHIELVTAAALENI